jgi:hypothetical protein
MESSLVLTTVGMVLFWFLAILSTQQNSPSLYTDSIVLMGSLFALGLALATWGLVRKGTMVRTLQAIILLLGSFIVGVVLLWMEWVMILVYSRITAPIDCGLYLCEPVFGVAQSLIMPIFLAVGVAAMVIVFLSYIASLSSAIQW